MEIWHLQLMWMQNWMMYQRVSRQIRMFVITVAGNAKGAASRASVPPLSTAHTIYRKGEQDNDRLSEQHFRKAGNHQGKRNHTERGALPFADADDTVVPRFNSAGGGGDRLIFIKEDEKSLTFGDDRIREAVEKYHAKLLILDPMSSYIGDTCSMNNANETRAEFNHLIAGATILMSWSLM